MRPKGNYLMLNLTVFPYKLHYNLYLYRINFHFCTNIFIGKPSLDNRLKENDKKPCQIIFFHTGFFPGLYEDFVKFRLSLPCVIKAHLPTFFLHQQCHVIDINFNTIVLIASCNTSCFYGHI